MSIDPAAIAMWAAERSLDRSEVERQVRSLQVLDAIAATPDLGQVLALKGGAATNLIYVSPDRFSRDLDFNVLRPADERWSAEHHESFRAPFQQAARRAGAALQFPPQTDHLLWECTFVFPGLFGGARTQVIVQVSTGFRVPIHPVLRRNSAQVAGTAAKNVTVADLHETLAGKIKAAIERAPPHPRDVFDIHRLRRHPDFSLSRAREAVVILVATTGKLDQRTLQDWRSSINAEQFANWASLEASPSVIPRGESLSAWAAEVVQQTGEFIRETLLLDERSRGFLNSLLDKGIIDGALLTDDGGLAKRIGDQPLLKWRAENVRRHYRGRTT